VGSSHAVGGRDYRRGFFAKRLIRLRLSAARYLLARRPRLEASAFWAAKATRTRREGDDFSPSRFQTPHQRAAAGWRRAGRRRVGAGRAAAGSPPSPFPPSAAASVSPFPASRRSVFWSATGSPWTWRSPARA
jgi:hypothetical protein